MNDIKSEIKEYEKLFPDKNGYCVMLDDLPWPLNQQLLKGDFRVAGPKLGVVIEELTDQGLSIDTIKNLTVEQATELAKNSRIRRIHLINLAEKCLT